MNAQERNALTQLCDELTELRQECALQSEERQRLLARIELEAAARRPITHLLAELMGTSTEETVRTLSANYPGAGTGQADEEVFGCPDGACDRVDGTSPAGPIPRCPLTGQPMRWR